MKIRIDFLDMDFDTSTFPRNRIETNQNDDPVFYCLPSKNEFTDLDREVLKYWSDYQYSCAESAAIQAAERRMGA